MSELYDHMGMPTLAAFLHAKIDESRRTQREISNEIGYKNPNVLSMIKHGHTKLPFEKIPPLAKALNVDVGHLFRLTVEQYWPGRRDLIKGIFGNVVSGNEMALISRLRVAFHNRDPAFTPEQIDAAAALLVGFRRPPGHL